MSVPPLDASGFLTWKLLHFLASQRPSAQEERGDERLNEARKLARDDEEIINPNDLEIARDKIIYAREIKAGLESKRGLPRYLQAREYRKASKETLKFVKTASERARDANIGHNLAIPGHDTVSIQRSRGFVSHVDVVPLQATAQNLTPVDSEASGEAQLYYSPDPLPTNVYVHSDPRTRSIRSQLGEMKPKVTTLVENMYNFQTSQAHPCISYNTRRAQELLAHMNFVYPEPRTGHDPYRHPIIQRAINNTWFRDKDDIGVVDHGHFSPLPVAIIALTLMVIECCIEEWSSGTRKDSTWEDAKFQTVYESHVSSLLDFQAHSPASRDLLYQLQCDLLQNAREHAGVTSDPITGSSRFPPGALDAVREADNQSSPTSPPGYDEHPIPRITTDSA